MNKRRTIAKIALLIVCIGGVLSGTASAQALADSPWGSQKHHAPTTTAAALVSGNGDSVGSSDDSPWGFH